jgi:hypothetical protein
MKTRLFKVLNFFALNILFFALYLNFIHKGSNTAPPVLAPTHKTVIINATVLERPELYLENASSKHISASQSVEQKENLEALKLYFN